jgi:hypothetical protein
LYSNTIVARGNDAEAPTGSPGEGSKIGIYTDRASPEAVTVTPAPVVTYHGPVAARPPTVTVHE